MLRLNTVAVFALVLIAALLLASGCVGLPQNGQPGAAPFAVDEATFPVIDFHRSGGPDGLDERAVMYLDGHVVLERAGEAPATFQLSKAAQSQIDAAFDAAQFFENARPGVTPTPVPAGATAYEINRHGLLLQGSLITSEETAPDWARPLIPLLNSLLLTPDPAITQPYNPAEPTPAQATAVAASPATAPAVVLLEFTSSAPGSDARVILNLDRTYSIARNGSVEEGELSEEEMAALLKTLEDANLRQQAGDYLSDEKCNDCTVYEVVYRNLFGEYAVRAAAGQEPAWLSPVIDALTSQFPPAPAVAITSPMSTNVPSLTASPTTTSSPQSSATTTATSTAAASPTTTPSPQPSATATATSAPAAFPTTSPSPAPSALPTLSLLPYSTLDFLADLADLGVQVEVAPGRVVKPYLSTYGLTVRVDGEPVEVFQYADRASLLADVDGLDATASSIDGLPLTWAAAPHFWRRGNLLALTVTDDSRTVDLINQVMGEPFAGQ